MKAVILAAGYGTRLQRDVSADRSGRFAHLVGVPKPLLPVGRFPLITHWVRALNRSGTVDGIYVVTNALHQAAFLRWAEQFPEVQVLSDQTRTNEERLGAVACLQLAVKHFNIQDHAVVIGGDTLFREDFSLSAVAQKLSGLQASSEDGCLVLSYQCGDQETQKYGILEVDRDLRVLRMKEKPEPTETESRRACPCFYAFSKGTLPLLDSFLQEKKVEPQHFTLRLLGSYKDSGSERLSLIRTLRLRKRTLRGTSCLGSFTGNPSTSTRSLAASTWGTCRPTWSVSGTSGRTLRRRRLTWFRRTRTSLTRNVPSDPKRFTL
ncbi:glucose-1-phosphate thymidylyltransferase isoform 1-T1 [Fundulus diaphanus]